MTFLIDGYNLMHAVGYLRPGLPAGGLEAARLRFLNWMAEEVRERGVVVRIVFDAQGSPRPSPETSHRGILVLFAHRQTADDRIEELLATESRPDQLTVVSNDTRLQEAGRRRGSKVHTCEQFLDWLIGGDQLPASQQPPVEEKPEASEGEVEEWLAVFSKPKRKPRRG